MGVFGNIQIPGFQEESAFSSLCPNLTYKQRIIGFGLCFFFGGLLSFIGTMTLIGGFSQKNITAFAVLYVFGNIIALVATGFLVGPKNQVNKMMDNDRKFSTLFFLAMLIVVFVVAMTKQNIWVVVICLFIQILAGIWYSATYIPFGRTLIKTVRDQLYMYAANVNKKDNHYIFVQLYHYIIISLYHHIIISLYHHIIMLYELNLRPSKYLSH
jgi:hypothetical protein